MYLPLKSGVAFHMVTGPSDANCPNEISKNTTGIPTMTNMMVNGMRNAPEMHTENETYLKYTW